VAAFYRFLFSPENLTELARRTNSVMTVKDTVTEILKHADGAIVGTHFEVNGIIENPVDENRVHRLMERVRGRVRFQNYPK
jgi:predicted TIM-barrel enzyme